MNTESNLFDRCGGIRPMAEIVGEAPSTVQSWKAAGRIPAGKQPTVIERCAAAGIRVTAHDVVFPMGDGPDSDHVYAAIASVDGESTGNAGENSPVGAAA